MASGKPFKKGKDSRRAKGGKRNPPGGRPTKAELKAREQAVTVWEREVAKREEKLAKRWVDRAMSDDAMLRDVRKTRIPDAKQEIEHTGHVGITIQEK